MLIYLSNTAALWGAMRSSAPHVLLATLRLCWTFTCNKFVNRYKKQQTVDRRHWHPQRVHQCCVPKNKEHIHEIPQAAYTSSCVSIAIPRFTQCADGTSVGIRTNITKLVE